MARILLIIGALVIALVSGLMVRNQLARQRGEVERLSASKVTKVDGVDVLVVNADVDISGIINAGQMKWQLWPKEQVHSRYVLKSSRPNAIEELAGSAARQPLFSGEPLTAEKIIRKGEGGFLAAVLQPGLRAVTLKVDEASGLAGLILPGDHVDLILTREVPPGEGPEANKGRRFSGETIVRDLRVLAVDQTFKSEDSKAAKAGKTVTLEVDASQAEAVMLAKAMGIVNLALRSSFGATVEDDREQKFTISDSVSGVRTKRTAPVPAPTPAPETESSGASGELTATITIYRGPLVETVKVAP